MSFTLKYNNGTIFDPINFRNASNLTAENIVTYMEEKAEEMQVPMQLSIDTVKREDYWEKNILVLLLNILIHHKNILQMLLLSMEVL